MKLVKFFAATIAAASMFVACEAPEENKPNGGEVIVQEYVQILCDVTASDWDTVGVWAWVEGGDNFTEAGVWPGDQLTETTEHDGKTVYIWNCPKELLGQSIQFILNDFNGVPAEDGSVFIEQTEDFTIVVAENLLVGLTEMGENGKWLMYGGEIFEKPEVEVNFDEFVFGDHTYGVIGSFAASENWSKDVLMEIVEGWATATVELEADAKFKVRVDGKWDYSFGYDVTEDAPLAPVNGTEFTTSFNGEGNDIIVAEAGSYKVEFKVVLEEEHNVGKMKITKLAADAE